MFPVFRKIWPTQIRNGAQNADTAYGREWHFNLLGHFLSRTPKSCVAQKPYSFAPAFGKYLTKRAKNCSDEKFIAFITLITWISTINSKLRTFVPYQKKFIAFITLITWIYTMHSKLWTSLRYPKKVHSFHNID